MDADELSVRLSSDVGEMSQSSSWDEYFPVFRRSHAVLVTYLGNLDVNVLFLPGEGERFFIQSVRYFKYDITETELKEAVSAFIGQEAFHGREHDKYNELLAQSGLPVYAMEKRRLYL